MQETKDMFLFYHSTLTMNLVPKRAFTAASDLESVRGFYEQRVRFGGEAEELRTQ